MRRKMMIALLAVGLFATAAGADPVATLSMVSSKNGQSVGQGAAIDWTIQLAVSVSDNAGLALVSCDLVQDTANPEKLDLPPATAVPSGMVGFSPPDGIANPGSAAPDFGYRGASLPEKELHDLPFPSAEAVVRGLVQSLLQTMLMLFF